MHPWEPSSRGDEIGTSGYNYPEWRGSFYPEKFSTAKMLPYYAARFTTVEINYTFYRMPNAKIIASWDAETPSGFLLRAQGAEAHHPRRAAQGRGRTAPVFPRHGQDSSGPSSGRSSSSFRRTSRRTCRDWAISSRGSRPTCATPSSSATRAGMPMTCTSGSSGRNAALCIADSEKGTTPLVATADFGYLRCAMRAIQSGPGRVEPERDAARSALEGHVRLLQARGIRQRPRLAGQFRALVSTKRQASAPPSPPSSAVCSSADRAHCFVGALVARSTYREYASRATFGAASQLGPSRRSRRFPAPPDSSRPIGGTGRRGVRDGDGRRHVDGAGEDRNQRIVHLLESLR